MANKFKTMDASNSKYAKRVMCLTADTSNALITLEGISALIKLLLSKGFKYILPGTIQSDRLEGEFGLYRQSSGGCYYISVQVINSLLLQRLKLFDKLVIDSKSHIKDDCCSADLNKEEISMLDECFGLVDILMHITRYHSNDLPRTLTNYIPYSPISNCQGGGGGGGGQLPLFQFFTMDFNLLTPPPPPNL